MKNNTCVFASLACAGLLCVMTPISALAETVGKMTAVQTQVRKAGTGVIGVGAGVSLGDRLRSNATGLGLIVFKDQSSVKLGPNSNLKIDEFVYSPGSNGNFGISMDRGVSRFFGGQVSKKGEMKITTPHVILGVRGGIVDTKVEDGETTGILRAGKLTCSIDGDVRVITKPGFACVSNGGSISVVKLQNSLDILDSPARIAGTNAPGNKGPGIEVDAGCAGPGASLILACRSRNGQLPNPGTTGRDPGGIGPIIRTGPQDNGNSFPGVSDVRGQ
jgi:hypothetical protein